MRVKQEKTTVWIMRAKETRQPKRNPLKEVEKMGGRGDYSRTAKVGLSATREILGGAAKAILKHGGGV